MATSVPSSRSAERFTQTVSALQTLDRDRYQYFVDNPDNQSPQALNQLIPEINDIELDNSQSNKMPGEVLHIAAWNLERGRHWRDAVCLIQTHPRLQRVDVWCLSEMDNGMVRSNNEHTTRELAIALGMNYAYGVEFLQLSIGTPWEREAFSGTNDRGYHGNAILSRFPLHSLRMIRLPGIEKWYGSFEHRLGGRQALFADIQCGDRTVTIVSTHLESGPREGDKRTQEGQLILQAITDEGGDLPVVICGDMNAAPETPVIENFRRAGFLVEETNELAGSTYQLQVDGLIKPGDFWIDYVMARGLQVAEGGAPERIMAAYPCEPTGKMLSDHAIVTVSLQVPA